MTLAYLAGNKITGTSGDSKPTTVPTNSIFIETDTRIRYLFDGATWNQFAGSSGTWSGDDTANMVGIGNKPLSSATFDNHMGADYTSNATASFLNTIT